MNQVLLVALIALSVGLVSLVIGLIARSVRVALGCAVTGAMALAGVAAAIFLWGLYQDWRAFQLERLIW